MAARRCCWPLIFALPLKMSMRCSRKTKAWWPGGRRRSPARATGRATGSMTASGPTLSPQVDGLQEHHALFRAYPSEQEPGLRVFVPSPEYMLAMKLMAMRLDPTGAKSDLTDILNLMDIVGLTTPEDAIDFAAAFYPEARISARLHLGIRALWRMKDQQTQEGQHGAPTYLGRGRASP